MCAGSDKTEAGDREGMEYDGNRTQRENAEAAARLQQAAAASKTQWWKDAYKPKQVLSAGGSTSTDTPSSSGISGGAEPLSRPDASTSLVVQLAAVQTAATVQTPAVIDTVASSAVATASKGQANEGSGCEFELPALPPDFVSSRLTSMHEHNLTNTVPSALIPFILDTAIELSKANTTEHVNEQWTPGGCALRVVRLPVPVIDATTVLDRLPRTASSWQSSPFHWLISR